MPVTAVNRIAVGAAAAAAAAFVGIEIVFPAGELAVAAAKIPWPRALRTESLEGSQCRSLGGVAGGDGRRVRGGPN